MSEFRCISEDEVLKGCPEKSKFKVSSGPFNTKMAYFIQHISVLLPTLSRILMLSGLFPGTFKKAVIAPIHKKLSLNKEEFNNYQPDATI